MASTHPLPLLLQAFGREEARRLVNNAPQLLAVNTSVWQKMLAVARLSGVAEPEALLSRTPHTFTLNWLAPDRLANRLALERCLGLTPAEVYEGYLWHLTTRTAVRLAGSLLYLQHRGLLHLVVPDKRQAKEQWRQARGLSVKQRAAGEPHFISVVDVCKRPDRFAEVVCKALESCGSSGGSRGGSSSRGGDGSRGASSSGSSSSGSSSSSDAKKAAANAIQADLQAFQADLPNQEEWRELWAAAEVAAQRLEAELPDVLKRQAPAEAAAGEQDAEVAAD